MNEICFLGLITIVYGYFIDQPITILRTTQCSCIRHLYACVCVYVCVWNTDLPMHYVSDTWASDVRMPVCRR